jgi:predicted N-acetyltransferase YhbS
MDTTVTVRAVDPRDAEACGRIFFDAFASIASRHNLPIEPGSPGFTRFLVDRMLASDGFTGLVAECGGEVVGSAFVDQRGVIAGIGPVTVDPEVQDRGIGRALMEAALRHAHAHGAPGIRLVQTAYHYRSLALYAKLGFVVREPLSVISGTPPATKIPGVEVRPARASDVDACCALCTRVHGHDRVGELRDAIAAGTALVAEQDDAVRAYATGLGYGFHAIATTNEDLMALIGSADEFVGLGILVPSRNAELLSWCLEHGLRIVQQSTLMTTGLYNEPAGPYLPSILF